MNEDELRTAMLGIRCCDCGHPAEDHEPDGCDVCGCLDERGEVMGLWLDGERWQG